MENKYDDIYDMIIVGGGPAGLSAAIYMSRAKYKTLVIEKEKIGGQITITDEIVNYPGIFKTSGKQLTDDMRRQAEHFGSEFKICEVVDLELEQDIKVVKTSAGEYRTLGVILAVGASPKKVGFEGEEKYQGRGVAYCATCDGEFFTGKPVYVVGGGFAAVEEGIFLTKYASSVDMIVRRDEFSCAKTASDHLDEEEKITVNFNTEVVEVSGENVLTSIKLRNKTTGEEFERIHENGFGVFVFAGYSPNTLWLGDKVRTQDGYIITDIKQRTNVDGVYAAGDVCIKDLRQVVTAVSDGATAATSAEKHVKSLHTKLDIPAFEILTKDSNIEHESKGEIKSSNSSGDEIAAGENFISEEIREQLLPIFAKFENKVIVKAKTDSSDLGKQFESLLDELKTVSDMIECEKTGIEDDDSPHIELLFEDGKTSGIKFYAMPGGHEFNSFIIALYNVAGPGVKIEPEIEERIKGADEPLDVKVLIALSCTMCPEVVTSAVKIASLNENVNASIIDIGYFQDIKEKYNVMSVPCMVVNDSDVHFGKKNISQVLDVLNI